MISTVIVIGTLLFAAVFAIAWLVSPKVRREVEQPKHHFQDSVQQFDRRYNPHSSSNKGSNSGASNESR